MTTSRSSLCRACINSCPVIAEVEGGRLVAISGDRSNALFGGYTCVKGRAQPAFHAHPDRLLHSQERTSDGSYRPIPVDDAIAAIADRIRSVLDRHGPGAIATYTGTNLQTDGAVRPVHAAFHQAIGSPAAFTASAIDKPGKNIAAALHGGWLAPRQGYDRPDVALLLGANPYQSYYGAAAGNPGAWLADQLRRGMALIVVDPRRSDVARRATLHLQAVPGSDVEILAALINVILTEGLHDRAFVEENAEGLDELRVAVAPFTPELVAARAGVAATDLVQAARTFAGAARGYAVAGVGPGFAASSSLVEYLVLDLETICGRWLRAGERVRRWPSLLRPPPPRAQPGPVRPAFGLDPVLPATGVGNTAAGMPTGVLADEILAGGEGSVRVLLSLGGNPVSAWPDQLKAIAAMRQLDLLVQIDPWWSATARLADYVIAPTMPYEVPGATFVTDIVMSQDSRYGPEVSHAQHTPAVVDPPPGAEVIPEWVFLHRLAVALGLELELRSYAGIPLPALRIDATTALTTDELLAHHMSWGRVTLEELDGHPHGLTVDPDLRVLPRDPACLDRMRLADPTMLADLAAVLDRPTAHGGTGSAEVRPFRLIGRRVQRAYNSSMRDPVTDRGRGYNAAFLHPLDLAALGLAPGDAVEISSARAAIPAVVDADETLRRGLVSMSHGFGDGPDRDDEFREIGSPTNRLLDSTDLADRYAGMPRIGDIPVAVTRLVRT